MLYAEITESGSRATGKLCEDGYGGSGCAPLDGQIEGATLTFSIATKDGVRVLTLTHDGDRLTGQLAGCSTCDGQPCMCDLPIILYRIG